MRERHQLHDGDMIRATLLRDGTVLVTGRGTAELYDPATGDLDRHSGAAEAGHDLFLVDALAGWHRADGGFQLVVGGSNPGAELYDPTTGSWTKSRAHALRPRSSATLLLDGTVLVAGGSLRRRALSSAQLYVPAGVSVPAAVVALPTPAPTPVPTPTPTPTPVPTPYPPAAGPVPPGARTWTVTVVNKSSEPATLFMAEDGENGIGQLCGSVTPNVVPAGVTAKVTFLLPPTARDGLLDLGEPGSGPGRIDVPDVRRPHGGQVRHPGGRERRAGRLAGPVGDGRYLSIWIEVVRQFSMRHAWGTGAPGRTWRSSNHTRHSHGPRPGDMRPAIVAKP